MWETARRRLICTWCMGVQRVGEIFILLNKDTTVLNVNNYAHPGHVCT